MHQLMIPSTKSSQIQMTLIEPWEMVASGWFDLLELLLVEGQIYETWNLYAPFSYSVLLNTVNLECEVQPALVFFLLGTNNCCNHGLCSICATRLLSINICCALGLLDIGFISAFHLLDVEDYCNPKLFKFESTTSNYPFGIKHCFATRLSALGSICPSFLLDTGIIGDI